MRLIRKPHKYLKSGRLRTALDREFASIKPVTQDQFKAKADAIQRLRAEYAAQPKLSMKEFRQTTGVVSNGRKVAPGRAAKDTYGKRSLPQPEQAQVIRLPENNNSSHSE